MITSPAEERPGAGNGQGMIGMSMSRALKDSIYIFFIPAS